MTKLAFIDLETTGGGRKKNHIWYLSAILVTESKRTHFEAGEDGLTCYPLSRGDFLGFQEFLSLAVDPFNSSDKLFFIGYNSYSDMDWVRDWFKRENDKYFGSWFWYPPIDVMQLAILGTAADRHLLEDFTLGTVCRYFKLDFDDTLAHGATDYDNRKAEELYWKLMKELVING